MMNNTVMKMMTEEMAIQLENTQTEEEFRRILTENGATEEDILQFVEDLRQMPDDSEWELTEEDLDVVAGGGNPRIQRAIARLAYRVKHRKIFVKSTYDESSRTITVTNVFGKKVSEEYMY